MKKSYSFLALGLLFLASTQVKAQVSTTDSTKTSTMTTTGTKIYLSATAATQGFGLDIKVAPKPNYAIRVGASILPIGGTHIYSVRSEPTDVALDGKLSNAHLMLDWHPWINGYEWSKKIVVTAGAGYFWENGGTATVSYRGTYKYGDILIPSSDLGVLIGDVRWNKVAPYLGFGFEQPFPKHKFNIGFAVGTYYMGEPDAKLTGTKFLAANTSNSAQFQENMSYYRFLPVLQINLNFQL